jgi:SAM-dependent methyltransferase
MHDTAMRNGKRFFDTYLPYLDLPTVVDIGAQNVNGSLREVCPATATYIGVDFVKGAGVDVVLDDPYKLPFEDGSIDAVVSSSCFEHSEFFWVLFLEILRVLKPAGLFYLNAPSNGQFHRYPVDCWRFYPDSGRALERWARANNVNATMLESYIGQQGRDGWNDFVCVFVKDDREAGGYRARMVSTFHDYSNGLTNEGSANAGFLNLQERTQDQSYLGWRIHRFILRRLTRKYDRP